MKPEFKFAAGAFPKLPPAESGKVSRSAQPIEEIRGSPMHTLSTAEFCPNRRPVPGVMVVKTGATGLDATGIGGG